MPSLHHIALACKDLLATHHFYNDLLGFPLVYAEMDGDTENGWLKHLFFDLGDGSCLAFFDLHGMGEAEGYETAISTGLGLPQWVNHVAIRSDAERVGQVKARMKEAGVKVEMVLDHGWCRSTYFTDPNGILVELTVDTPGFEPDPEEALRVLRAASPRPAEAAAAQPAAAAPASPPSQGPEG